MRRMESLSFLSCMEYIRYLSSAIRYLAERSFICGDRDCKKMLNKCKTEMKRRGDANEICRPYISSYWKDKRNELKRMRFRLAAGLERKGGKGMYITFYEILLRYTESSRYRPWSWKRLSPSETKRFNTKKQNLQLN